MTQDQLTLLCESATRASKFVDPLNAAMAKYQINTKPRIAAFLGQILHESGSLVYAQEIASGAYYEGRKDLGNVNRGDGIKFKGRGLIQITGRANYEKCSLALFGDTRLLDSPALLEHPDFACLSAGWFWASHGLNGLADAGNYKTITRRINGGLNGYDERVRLYNKALAIL